MEMCFRRKCKCRSTEDFLLAIASEIGQTAEFMRPYIHKLVAEELSAVGRSSLGSVQGAAAH